MNNVYDYILKAENFISYIIGIHLLNIGHKVLIIDNPQINIPRNIIEKINLLELSLIKKIANKYNIVPLKYLDNYINKDTYTIVFEGKQILLGNSVQRNLKEILRKFPFLFMDPTEITNEDLPLIEEHFYKHIENICSLLLEEGKTNFRKIDEKYFTFKCDLCNCGLENNQQNYFKILQSFITTIFNIQKAKVLSTEKLFLKTFNDLLQLITIHYIGNHSNNFTIFELFVSLLSPSYNLNVKKLNKELNEMFIRRGGVLAQEHEQKQDQKEKNIKLCDYYDYGDYGVDTNFTYSYLQFTQNNPYPLRLSNNLIISSINSILEDIPYIEIKSSGDYFVPYIKKEGFSHNYYKNKILNSCESSFGLSGNTVNKMAISAFHADVADSNLHNLSKISTLPSLSNLPNLIEQTVSLNNIKKYKKIAKTINNYSNEKIIVEGCGLIPILLKINHHLL
ncbi:MAG: hypothetical protein HQK51_00220 [Oligoflexia bacterium]|nr:hypothetical protein [Oligoflexia bacterium]